MSGIDEQDRDVTPCGCRKFLYWTILDENNDDLAYLNTDKWLEKNYTCFINRMGRAANLTKDEFINKIGSFYCEWCKRIIRKRDEMFAKLLSDVKIRWDMGYVGD